MGLGTSILLVAVGAILKFAVHVQTDGFDLNTIGLILMIVGIVGVVLSMFFWRSWGGAGVGGTYRRSRTVYEDPATGRRMVSDSRDDVL